MSVIAAASGVVNPITIIVPEGWTIIEGDDFHSLDVNTLANWATNGGYGDINTVLQGHINTATGLPYVAADEYVVELKLLENNTFIFRL